VQSVPAYSPASIAQKIKSITARKIFEACPKVKRELWGGEFWTRGYYIGTVGEHGDEKTIARYVRNQGRKPEEYEKTYENKQNEWRIKNNSKKITAQTNNTQTKNHKNF
jgi:putative transposase